MGTEVPFFIIVLGGMYALLAFVVQAFSLGYTRRRLGEAGLSAEQLGALMSGSADADASLKWGLVTTAVGVAVVVIQFFPPEQRQGPLALGLPFLLGGLSLLLHYRLARRRGPS